MRVAIVDDEKKWREEACKIVQAFYDNAELKVDVFENGPDYINSEETYDITLMDIEMPGVDGFETILKARECEKDSLFVILTTHLEMSRKGYMVDAYRYIDKLHMCEELNEALVSAEALLQRNEKISVNIVGEGVREITLKNIVYIETEKHNVIIHTKHGKKKSNKRLSEFEGVLNNKIFYRCHNAYIVNLDEIKAVKDSILYMSNGMNLYVSERRKSEFKKIYLQRMYECANA